MVLNEEMGFVEYIVGSIAIKSLSIIMITMTIQVTQEYCHHK